MHTEEEDDEAHLTVVSDRRGVAGRGGAMARWRQTFWGSLCTLNKRDMEGREDGGAREKRRKGS